MVSSEGKYTDVLGVDAPFENAGIVDSYGMELGLNYTKRLGDVVFNLAVILLGIRMKLRNNWKTAFV